MAVFTNTLYLTHFGIILIPNIVLLKVFLEVSPVQIWVLAPLISTERCLFNAYLLLLHYAVTAYYNSVLEKNKNIPSVKNRGIRGDSGRSKAGM